MLFVLTVFVLTTGFRTLNLSFQLRALKFVRFNPEFVVTGFIIAEFDCAMKIAAVRNTASTVSQPVANDHQRLLQKVD